MTEDTGKNVIDRTADLTEAVFKAVEAGQKAAIDAVRKFVETIDKAIPEVGASPAQRQTVIDAALDMADNLVTAQYNFLSSIVRNVDRSVAKTESKEEKRGVGTGGAASVGLHDRCFAQRLGSFSLPIPGTAVSL